MEKNDIDWLFFVCCSIHVHCTFLHGVHITVVNQLFFFYKIYKCKKGVLLNKMLSKQNKSLDLEE